MKDLKKKLEMIAEHGSPEEQAAIVYLIGLIHQTICRRLEERNPNPRPTDG